MLQESIELFHEATYDKGSILGRGASGVACGSQLETSSVAVLAFRFVVRPRRDPKVEYVAKASLHGLNIKDIKASPGDLLDAMRREAKERGA